MKNNYLLENRTYKNQNWNDLQSALMQIAKSFPDDYKFGAIDENQKSIVIIVTKIPFYEGIDFVIECTESQKDIIVNIKMDDDDVPMIKKEEAKKLGKELASNIYYSFNETLHLTAKDGELKDKREQQLTGGSGIISFILLIISIVIIFYSVNTCSGI
jgi:hypothetical protein